MTKQTKFFLILVIAGVVFLVGYHLTVREREGVRPPLILEKGFYQLGGIIVDTRGGEIRFEAEVQKKEGWVQHLMYLQGYRWLKEESAIIADAKLADLQKAIALLDWELWDELWHKKTRGRRQEIENRKLLLFVQWDRKRIPAQELVLTEDKLEIENFIFLGSPYFDHITLGAPHAVDCKACPLFPLKEKALRELFIRESGQSGYELNSERMPAQGTEVSVIIRLPK